MFSPVTLSTPPLSILPKELTNLQVVGGGLIASVALTVFAYTKGAFSAKTQKVEKLQAEENSKSGFSVFKIAKTALEVVIVVWLILLQALGLGNAISVITA